MEETIAAIATPQAPAGLGIIRLSGEQAAVIADRMFRPVTAGKTLSVMKGYTAAYGHVFDADGDIDECVALVFRAPHSYTGENAVELSCHGGLYVLQRTLRAAISAGARPAGGGEFTKRAFLNGKTDLTGAEAVMSLIGAEGNLAARTALAAREGAVFQALSGVKETLLAAQAQFSALVDYPDDDIPELQPDVLRATLITARETVVALLSTYDAGRVLREGLSTAIVGSPNVGKSTLMNWLSGCERSIVTPVAGTTRDVVEETVRLGDVTLRLADTAGIRETGDVAEAIGVDRARSRLHTAALVLAVFDASRPLSEDDQALLAELDADHTIALINKTDCSPVWEDDIIRATLPRTVAISAKQHTGREELSRLVAEAAGVAGMTGAGAILSTERQRACAAETAACLSEAIAALDAGMTLDAVSVSVDGAVSAVLELTGERATEAVVDAIFSRFCVGK